MTNEEAGKVAAMQANYEERIARQSDRLTVMLTFLEDRDLVTDFTDFAAHMAVGKDRAEPVAADSDDKKEEAHGIS